MRSEARVGWTLQQDSPSQAGEQGHKGHSGGPGVEPGAREGWYLSTVRKQADSQKVTLTGWIFFANEVSADQLRELFSGLGRQRAVQRQMKKEWTVRPWTQPERTTFYSFPNEGQEWEERSKGRGKGTRTSEDGMGVSNCGGGWEVGR